MAGLSSNDDKDNHIVFANEGMHHQFRLLLSLFSRHNNKEETCWVREGHRKPVGEGRSVLLGSNNLHANLHENDNAFVWYLHFLCCFNRNISQRTLLLHCQLQTCYSEETSVFFYDWIFFNPGKFKKKRLPENIPFYFSASEEVFTFDKHTDKNFK